MKKDPAPLSNVTCLYHEITAIAAQHFFFGGGGGGGLKRQARGAKRDHSDEIGCYKGKCVNNFGAD